MVCKVTFLLWVMQTFFKKNTKKIDFFCFMLYNIFLIFDKKVSYNVHNTQLWMRKKVVWKLLCGFEFSVFC